MSHHYLLSGQLTPGVSIMILIDMFDMVAKQCQCTIQSAHKRVVALEFFMKINLKTIKN